MNVTLSNSASPLDAAPPNDTAKPVCRYLGQSHLDTTLFHAQTRDDMVDNEIRKAPAAIPPVGSGPQNSATHR
ncbi:hypothetical protein [Nocardia pseudovaccinii]|uniref:hypothetical protein n=1 Tax=Nocardia pseudovaccinii TaxID=189540 RepID=UPI0007A523C2|nr:hypothetical protein [Nocardia pseudovaccinii]